MPNEYVSLVIHCSNSTRAVGRNAAVAASVKIVAAMAQSRAADDAPSRDNLGSENQINRLDQ